MSSIALVPNTHQILNEVGLHDIRPEKQRPIPIVFTSMNGTRKALEKAAQLTEAMQCGIEVLGVQTVPYALPLDAPQIPLEVLTERLEQIVTEFPQVMKVSIYICRDAVETLKCVLTIHSPVVMSVSKTFWPNRDKRLARKLRRAGYPVITVETE
jgi:hypothetical protein